MNRKQTVNLFSNKSFDLISNINEILDVQSGPFEK